jgi:hypothetical protein
MRGALQARTARLPNTSSGLRWSSKITFTRGKRRPRIDELEKLERFRREQRRSAQLGETTLDPRREWIRRF